MRFTTSLQAALFIFCIFLETANAKLKPLPLHEGSPIFVEQERRPFPDIRFYDAHGMQFRLSDYRGKMVLLNFWATWCAPCIRELPLLDELQAQHKDKLSVIAISEDRAGFGAITNFLEKRPVEHLAVFHDKNTLEFRKLQMRGLPMSFLIDAEGKLIATVQGEIDWLSEDIEGLLKKKIGMPKTSQ